MSEIARQVEDLTERLRIFAATDVASQWWSGRQLGMDALMTANFLDSLLRETEWLRAELRVIAADRDVLRALCDELAGRAEHAEMEVAALCGGDYDAVKTERDALARKMALAKHVLHGFSLAMNGWGWHQEKAREVLAALDAREEGASK